MTPQMAQLVRAADDRLPGWEYLGPCTIEEMITVLLKEMKLVVNDHNQNSSETAYTLQAIDRFLGRM